MGSVSTADHENQETQGAKIMIYTLMIYTLLMGHGHLLVWNHVSLREDS